MPSREESSRKRRDTFAVARPVASLVFVAGYSLLVLAQPTGPLRAVCLVLLLLSWVVQIASYVSQLVRSGEGRRRFARTHRLDLAAAIFPLLGIFTLLGLLHRVRGFRGESGNALRSRIAVRAGGYAATFVYVIALTELAVERSAPHSTIHTFGEAIWWACVTITTIGYGDYTPVTTVGRLIAIVLMGGGLVIIGTASALIVSYISERVHLGTAAGQPAADGHDDRRATDQTAP